MEPTTQQQIIDFLHQNFPWIGAVNKLFEQIAEDSEGGFSKATLEVTANSGTITELRVVQNSRTIFKQHPTQKIGGFGQ